MIDSRTRFLIRRCYEKGYPVSSAAYLSDCPEHIVRTFYDRFSADRMKRYDRFLAMAGKSAK